MTLHLSYSFGIFQLTLLFYQIFECTNKVDGAIDYPVSESVNNVIDDKLDSRQSYLINANGFPTFIPDSLRNVDQLYRHVQESHSSPSSSPLQSYSSSSGEPFGLIMTTITSEGKRAGNGQSKSRKLRSGSMQEKVRYKGGKKWKKYPEAQLKAGDIARLLMEIAERRGISYNNKAIRYGLS